MPGLSGYISTHIEGAVPSGKELAFSMIHEPFYNTQTIPARPYGTVIVIGNGSCPLLSGVAADGDITTAYYGEFYNQEFSGCINSDHVGRVLIDLYRIHGERLPDVLDGSFVVYVADSSTTILFNDHYASRQLFYAFQNESLYFAPELKGVSQHRTVDRTLDADAFVCFLVNGSLLGTKSFYKHICALHPGHVLMVRNGKLTMRQYYRYEPAGTGKDLGEAYYSEALADLLIGAVRRRLRNLNTMVIPLSGGIDSRGILGCIHALSGGQKLNTVTWGKDDTTPGADADVARQVSRMLDTEHQFIQRRNDAFVDNFEDMFYRIDGLTDDAWMHQSELRTMQRLRSECQADALWRGEECFGHWPRPVSAAAARINTGIHSLGDHPELLRVLSSSLRGEFLGRSEQLVSSLEAQCPLQNLTDRRDYWYFTQRLFHYHTRCAYFKLTVLEVKSPWLDKRIITFLQDLPAHYRYERALYKKTLCRLFPELMAIPPATSNSLENWLDVFRQSQPIQAFIRYHLLESRNALHEWLDRDGIKNLLEDVFKGRRQQRGRWLLGSARKVLRQASPSLFDFTKSLAGSRIALFYPISPAFILFRLMTMKRWFDRFV